MDTCICATRFAADAAPGKIGLKPKDNVTRLFIVSQRAATDRTINGKITLRVALARPVGRRNRLHRTHLKTKKPRGKTAGLCFEFHEEDEEEIRPWQAWRRPTLPSLEA
jgi:hypothetical protein